MEHIDQNIDIDLIDPIINVAYCNQYENASRRIICHVLKEGKAYNIPSNISVLLRIHKANHYNLYENVNKIGEIDGNTIIIPLMPELTKSYGRHECIFEFIDTTEEKLLYSTKFYIRVAKSPIQNENIQDSHEYTALVDFMNTKGKANGIASLDENGKVPLEELYEATTLDKGITQLTDSILSNSITTAATPNSVKITYDAVTAEKERATAAENDLGLNKADIASPTLTGTPKAPTASAGTNTTQIATTEFVQTAVSNGIAASDALIFKGTIGANGTVTTLPDTYKTGWTYRVVSAGTYAGQICEIGDLIIALADRDGSEHTDSDWCVAQTNIDGAIIHRYFQNGDFNSITIPGFYATYNCSNTPSDTTNYSLIVLKSDHTTCTHQIAIPENSTNIYMRSCSSKGIWSSWVISHPAITVSTDSTSTASPSAGETFTVVDSVTKDDNGHVIKINTKIVTLPDMVLSNTPSTTIGAMWYE